MWTLRPLRDTGSLADGERAVTDSISIRPRWNLPSGWVSIASMRSFVLMGGLLALSIVGCRPAAGPRVVSEPSLHTEAATPSSPPAEEREALREEREALREEREAQLRRHWACDPEGADFRVAREELRALETDIESLADLDDPGPLLARIDALLENSCMGISRMSSVPRAAQSGLALRTWWTRGGMSWLAASLNVARGDQPPALVLPPTMPSTLSLETHPDHPLAPLLCSLHDQACADSTGGWRARALQVTTARYWTLEDEYYEYCEQSASDRNADDPFAYWAGCVFRAEGTHMDFPLGGLRAPSRGWLVLEGRRGHYSFCDELHAYDLATGSAHVVRRCSGLELNNDASVNEDAVASRSRLEVKRGTVPPDNVRELAWMLLVADHTVSPAISETTDLTLPETIAAPRGPRTLDIAARREIRGSNQTTLHWSLSSPVLGSLEGSLHWPPAYNPSPLEHAAMLWSVAEEGIASTCPPRSIPKTLPLAPTLGGVSTLDASPETLDQTHHVLKAALYDGPDCRAGRRRKTSTR